MRQMHTSILDVKPASVAESNQGTTVYMYNSHDWAIWTLQPSQVASTIHRYPFTLFGWERGTVRVN